MSPPPAAQPVLLLSRDLLIGSQVLGAARGLGIDARQVNGPAELAAMETRPRLVLIDLSLPGLAVAEVVAGLRELDAPPRIVAFGPHVHAGLLSAAREAGCDEVLTRGQFTAQIASVLGSPTA